MTDKHYMIYINEGNWGHSRWQHYHKGQNPVCDAVLHALEDFKQHVKNLQYVHDFSKIDNPAPLSGYCENILQQLSKVVYPIDLPSHDEEDETS